MCRRPNAPKIKAMNPFLAFTGLPTTIRGFLCQHFLQKSHGLLLRITITTFFPKIDLFGILSRITILTPLCIQHDESVASLVEEPTIYLWTFVCGLHLCAQSWTATHSCSVSKRLVFSLGYLSGELYQKVDVIQNKRVAQQIKYVVRFRSFMNTIHNIHNVCSHSINSNHRNKN